MCSLKFSNSSAQPAIFDDRKAASSKSSLQESDFQSDITKLQKSFAEKLSAENLIANPRAQQIMGLLARHHIELGLGLKLERNYQNETAAKKNQKLRTEIEEFKNELREIFSSHQVKVNWDKLEGSFSVFTERGFREFLVQEGKYREKQIAKRQLEDDNKTLLGRAWDVVKLGAGHAPKILESAIDLIIGNIIIQPLGFFYGVFTSANPLVTARNAGASFIENNRQFFLKYTGSSAFGTDAEFSKMGDWAAAMAFNPLGHIGNTVFEPGFEMVSIAFDETCRGIHNRFNEKQISYQELKQLQQTDPVFRWSKNIFHFGEATGAIALLLATQGGTFSRIGKMLGISSGMSLATATAEELLDPKDFNFQRFVDSVISGTAQSLLFMGGMSAVSKGYVRFRYGAIPQTAEELALLTPENYQRMERVLAQAKKITGTIDFIDGHSDLSDAIQSLDRVQSIKNLEQLAGALMLITVSGFDVADYEKANGGTVKSKYLNQSSDKDNLGLNLAELPAIVELILAELPVVKKEGAKRPTAAISSSLVTGSLLGRQAAMKFQPIGADDGLATKRNDLDFHFRGRAHAMSGETFGIPDSKRLHLPEVDQFSPTVIEVEEVIASLLEREIDDSSPYVEQKGREEREKCLASLNCLKSILGIASINNKSSIEEKTRAIFAYLNEALFSENSVLEDATYLPKTLRDRAFTQLINFLDLSTVEEILATDGSWALDSLGDVAFSLRGGIDNFRRLHKKLIIVQAGIPSDHKNGKSTIILEAMYLAKTTSAKEAEYKRKVMGLLYREQSLNSLAKQLLRSTEVLPQAESFGDYHYFNYYAHFSQINRGLIKTFIFENFAQDDPRYIIAPANQAERRNIEESCALPDFLKVNIPVIDNTEQLATQRKAMDKVILRCSKLISMTLGLAENSAVTAEEIEEEATRVVNGFYGKDCNQREYQRYQAVLKLQEILNWTSELKEKKHEDPVWLNYEIMSFIHYLLKTRDLREYGKHSELILFTIDAFLPSIIVSSPSKLQGMMNPEYYNDRWHWAAAMAIRGGEPALKLLAQELWSIGNGCFMPQQNWNYSWTMAYAEILAEAIARFNTGSDPKLRELKLEIIRMAKTLLSRRIASCLNIYTLSNAQASLCAETLADLPILCLYFQEAANPKTAIYNRITLDDYTRSVLQVKLQFSQSWAEYSPGLGSMPVLNPDLDFVYNNDREFRENIVDENITALLERLEKYSQEVPQKLRNPYSAAAAESRIIAEIREGKLLEAEKLARYFGLGKTRFENCRNAARVDLTATVDLNVLRDDDFNAKFIAAENLIFAALNQEESLENIAELLREHDLIDSEQAQILTQLNMPSDSIPIATLYYYLLWENRYQELVEFEKTISTKTSIGSLRERVFSHYLFVILSSRDIQRLSSFLQSSLRESVFKLIGKNRLTAAYLTVEKKFQEESDDVALVLMGRIKEQLTPYITFDSDRRLVQINPLGFLKEVISKGSAFDPIQLVDIDSNDLLDTRDPCSLEEAVAFFEVAGTYHPANQREINLFLQQTAEVVRRCDRRFRAYVAERMLRYWVMAVDLDREDLRLKEMSEEDLQYCRDSTLLLTSVFLAAARSWQITEGRISFKDEVGKILFKGKWILEDKDVRYNLECGYISTLLSSGRFSASESELLLFAVLDIAAEEAANQLMLEYEKKAEFKDKLASLSQGSFHCLLFYAYYLFIEYQIEENPLAVVRPLWEEAINRISDEEGLLSKQEIAVGLEVFIRPNYLSELYLTFAWGRLLQHFNLYALNTSVGHLGQAVEFASRPTYSFRAQELATQALYKLMNLPGVWNPCPVHLNITIRREPLGIENIKYLAFILLLKDSSHLQAVNEQISEHGFRYLYRWMSKGVISFDTAVEPDEDENMYGLYGDESGLLRASLRTARVDVKADTKELDQSSFDKLKYAWYLGIAQQQQEKIWKQFREEIDKSYTSLLGEENPLALGKLRVLLAADWKETYDSVEERKLEDGHILAAIAGFFKEIMKTPELANELYERMQELLLKYGKIMEKLIFKK